ncbi:hydrolase [Stenotrophomonas panacihumi]|uniref:Hydrolase n=1 Tax=Stenotrophomonas panacihumi TaxID=676599 RepID=A0A0R0ADH4_9GAMM|nr:HAD-IA family hydrolase [Stenotrophomonas panacihumi]KRG38803.1 hydrolase [Stenotrophomonas panacihumi]PTN53345.1 hydrolase [Stenotrophomonas panacihumi]
MTPHLPLRTLLLDFDGVLAQYTRATRLGRLAEHAGCSAAHVHEVLFASGLETAYDGGEVETGEYLDRLGVGIGRPVDEATWIDARVAACRPFAEVVEAARRLSTRMQVAVLTNNGPLMAKAVARIVPGLEVPVFCSGQLGGRKPQREVYERALEALGAQARRTLFVDDLFVNVRGARAAGLWADTSRDPRAFRRVLFRYGVGV